MGAVVVVRFGSFRFIYYLPCK